MAKIVDYEIKTGWKYVLMICKVERKSKGQKIRENDIILEHHLKTGETFFIQGLNKVDISYGDAGFVPCCNELYIFSKQFKKKDPYPIWSFLEILFKKRGIRYANLKEFHPNGKDRLYRLNAAFVFLRFPMLQHLPFRGYSLIGKNIIKQLDACTGALDVWKLFTGHQAKSIRDWCDIDERKMKILMDWGHEFTDPDALLLFAKNVKENNSNLYPCATGEHKDYNYEEYVDVFRFGKLLYDTEYRLIEEILKTKTSDRYFADLMRTLYDTKRIYTHIKEYKNGFVLPKNKNLEKLHDDLSDYLHELKEQNIIISYEDDEKKVEENYNDYAFKLVKDTHELQRVGKTMHHCVYGYKERALSKKCTIVVLKEKEDLKICIELNDKKIVQAKGFYNKLPDEIQCILIKDWAKKKGLYIQTSDIA